MKKLPISIQTFESIIEQDLIYVDKTRFIHQLVNGGKYYFLARPRRFGKSLLLTTLKSYFLGRKDLFKGLYIYQKEKDWTFYPVIHIDYSLVDYNTSLEIFNISMLNHLQTIADQYDLILTEKVISDAFNELVLTLQKKYNQKVVVLVDEYDKPLVDALTQPERFADNRNVLRNLYGAMKGLDSHLRFALLTGVSRFSKVSVFSGLNNLEDISLDKKFSTIVGFTQEELETNFDDYLQLLSQTFDMPLTELMPHIKEWYNGFSFDGVNKLYNPFSVIKLFKEQEFRNHWFSTGTPTFLIDLIKEQKQLPEKFEHLKVNDLTGGTTQIKVLPLIPLLYQTGYLTIERSARDGLSPVYYLNYPNREVRQSFLTYITAAFVNKHEIEIQPEGLALRDALIAEDIPFFVKKFQSFLSDIPSRLHIPREAYYHSLVYLILRVVGCQLILEKETDKGRIDAVLELPDKYYIIEFKFAKLTKVKRVATLSSRAIKQIKAKKYYEPYLASGKRILLLGLGFLNKELHGRVEEKSSKGAGNK